MFVRSNAGCSFPFVRYPTRWKRGLSASQCEVEAREQTAHRLKDEETIKNWKSVSHWRFSIIFLYVWTKLSHWATMPKPEQRLRFAHNFHWPYRNWNQYAIKMSFNFLLKLIYWFWHPCLPIRWFAHFLLNFYFMKWLRVFLDTRASAQKGQKYNNKLFKSYLEKK